MSSFAITAMGRSGTKFLAQVMNESKQWTVRHEPSLRFGSGRDWSRQPVPMDVAYVKERFNQDFYGEVNSYLRHVLLGLHVNDSGVILRDPNAILLSAMNRPRSRKMTPERIDMMAAGYQMLDDALRRSMVKRIWFERMTTDVSYLRRVLREFGITDVSTTKATLSKKVNATKAKRYEKYEDLPAPVRRYYEAQTNWYRKKYYACPS